MIASPKILVALHNVFIGDVVKNRLNAQGFRVLIAHSGDQVLKMVHEENPSVIIIGGRIAGFEDFVVELSAIEKKNIAINPKIIVLTSTEIPEDQRNKYPEIFQEGNVLSKWNIESLLEMVWSFFGPEELEKFRGFKKPQPVENASKGQKNLEETVTSASDDGKALWKALKSKTATPEEIDVAVVEIIDNMVEYAFLSQVSDIHIDVEQDIVLIRLRINGQLVDAFTLPKELHATLIGRIKVLSGMRTDEHRIAQDGRFKTDAKTVHQEFDVRVSILPSYFGEAVVLRLLVEQVKMKSIADLPMDDVSKERILRAMHKPSGMILITGPTGCGKTTTMYTMLREMNSRSVSTITIEDPVEFSVPGIKQIQVNNEVDLTFANALRSILRQDPNIIMVGEIRDSETAGIAINAALTGHQVISTLHTNDVVSTLPRLIDMGAETYLIASTIKLAIAQRLIRTICPDCKVEKKLTDIEVKSLKEIVDGDFDPSQKFYVGSGCIRCNNSGYAGRTGIYEVLEVSDAVRTAILGKLDASSIKKIALQEGMITLLMDGFNKAQKGITTIEEVLRVLRE